MNHSSDHPGSSHAHCHPDDLPPTDDEQSEEQAFQRIIDVYLCYKEFGLERIDKQINFYDALPQRQKALLPGFLEFQERRKECVNSNCELIKKIISKAVGMFMNADYAATIFTSTGDVIWKKPSEQSPPIDTFDMERLLSMLKHFVRDWAAEGAPEREMCYRPVLDALDARFGQRCRPEVKVVVAGSGLSRLSYEVVRRGYSCQGNEFAYMMLTASNYILNFCTGVNECVLYPYVLSSCNNYANEDVFTAITFPDVNPAVSPDDRAGDFSMAAGDFEQVYGDTPESVDCLLTVFFLDTAHNILGYIEVIHKMLKSGGYWINFGPLMYHFADSPNEDSLELSYEEIRSVVTKAGFEIEEEKLDCVSHYARNENAMLKNEYRCSYLVCRKP